MIEADQKNAEVICATAPMGLLAELTHRCPLQCPYCSNPTELERASGELSTEDWTRVFKEAGDLGILQAHLSGGEPTVRKDLEEITAAAVDAGIYTNLITAGVLLSKERLERLRRGPAAKRHAGERAARGVHPAGEARVAARRCDAHLLEQEEQVGRAVTLHLPPARARTSRLDDLTLDLRVPRRAGVVARDDAEAVRREELGEVDVGGTKGS